MQGATATSETARISRGGDAIAPLLELRNVHKYFPGVKALNDVSLTINPGEIHILLGENGAGKSTLIKTIIGVETANAGEMFWNGEPIRHRNIREAYDLGIAAIWQELSNIPCLSVAENMFLGNEIPIGGLRHTVDWKRQYAKTTEALSRVGLDIDPRTPMEKLGMGQKQLCEIAKALDRNARLIIMDEPTSSLSRREIDHLLEMMHELREDGVSILFITHKLDEAKKVGDVVTILKDGRKTGETMPIADVSEKQIITMMVGRELSEKFPKRIPGIGETIFTVRNLTGIDFRDVSFSLRRGELLGLFGLVGAGRTEVMRAIFGADEYISGEMLLEDRPYSPKCPNDAIANGIALLTENRKEEGLVLIHDLVENSTLPTLRKYIGGLRLLNQKSRLAKTMESARFLNLRPMDSRRSAVNFSGGNQQKIVISKWLNSSARIIIFDEPTKGVDVGAKIEIYSIMNALLRQGAAIIMVSSEIPEIMGMADRIITMYEGAVTGELRNDHSITQEQILSLATGGR